MAKNAAKPPKASPSLRLFSWICLVAGATMAIGLGLAYGLRPDELAWLTIVPAWAWWLPALALLFPSLIAKATRRLAWPALLLWLAFTGICVEESRSLLRGLLPAAKPPGIPVRVVCLNCSVGNLDAARDAIRQNPDIILLQESPGRPALETLAKASLGETGQVLAGADASIIVRGEILAVAPTPAAWDFVQARVRLARSGQEVEVISLRFRPHFFLINNWSSFRRDFLEDRTYRQQAVQVLAARLRTIPEGVPVVFGGDFNMPSGEPCLAALAPRFHDAFDTAGTGWGNTAIDPLFVHRIDQIWTSRQLHPVRVVAQGCQHSDHRMVVADLALAGH